MARMNKKKARAHVAAANSQAARWKQNGPKNTAAATTADALGAAAAVAATFGTDDANDDATNDETQPIDNEQSGDEGESSALSRGQRKRMKRRTAFMKKLGLVQRVTQAKAKEQQQQEHGMFADLAELQASLFVSDKDAAAAANDKKSGATTALQSKKMSGKQRQKLAVRELVHLKAVHAHASFQGNPFAAIQMHLQNTVVQANHENVKKTAPKKPTASSMDTN